MNEETQTAVSSGVPTIDDIFAEPIEETHEEPASEGGEVLAGQDAAETEVEELVAEAEGTSPESDDLDSLLKFEPDAGLPDEAKKRFTEQVKGVEKIVKRDYVEPAQQFQALVNDLNNPVTAINPILALAGHVKNNPYLYDGLSAEHKTAVDALLGNKAESAPVQTQTQPAVLIDESLLTDNELALYKQNQEMAKQLAALQDFTKAQQLAQQRENEFQLKAPALKENIKKFEGVEASDSDIRKAMSLPMWSSDPYGTLKYVLQDTLKAHWVSQAAAEKPKKPEGVSSNSRGGSTAIDVSKLAPHEIATLTLLGKLD